jgi:hypothetical protein
VKTLIVTLVAVVSLVLAGFAFADSSGSSASPCGAAHGAFADANGSFGWLGEMGGTPGYHDGAVGQDPGATGYNNSHTDCQGG